MALPDSCSHFFRPVSHFFCSLCRAPPLTLTLRPVFTSFPPVCLVHSTSSCRLPCSQSSMFASPPCFLLSSDCFRETGFIESLENLKDDTRPDRLTSPPQEDPPHLLIVLERLHRERLLSLRRVLRGRPHANLHPSA